MKFLKFENLKLGFEYDDPKKFLTSQWQKSDKSLKYVIYRVMIAIFFSFSFINGIVYSATRNQLLMSFIFLTRLNMLATAITCSIGAYYAMSFYFDRIMSLDRMTFGLKVYWFMYNNIVPFALVVSLVYWSLLYGTENDDQIDLINILMHLTNSFVLLIDLLVIQHEYRVLHFLYALLCGTFYLVFTIVYPLLGGVNGQGHNYVYSVLNWKEEPVKGVIISVGVYLALFTFHMLICGIAKLKQIVYDCLMLKSKNSIELQVTHLNETSAV